MAEFTRCHTFTKEINHASARSKYFKENFYRRNCLRVFLSDRKPAFRRISCHGRNCSQPYFFKRNQSSDNRSHGFGAKFLLKKLSASDFSYERKSAFRETEAKSNWSEGCYMANISTNL